MIQVENLPSKLASNPLMKHSNPTTSSIPSALLQIDLADLAAGEAWEGALRANDFEAALVEIEKILNSDQPGSSNLGATNRLWWARCQLQTNTVPLTALTAPVDEIFPAITNEPKLHLLGCSTLALLSARLAERGQSRLALVMLGNAFQLAAITDGVSGATHKALGDAYSQAIDDELRKIEGKKDPKGYAAALLQKRDAISRSIKVQPTARGLKQNTETWPSLSAPQTPKATDDQSFVWGSSSFPATDGPQLKPKSSRAQLFGIGGAVAVLLVLLASWESVFSPATSSEEEAEPGYILAMNSPLFSASATMFMLPRLTPRPSDALFQKLGDLGSNLDQVGERLRNIGGGKAPTETRSLEQMSEDPEIDSAALATKEGKALRLAKASPKADDELESFGTPQAEPTLDPQRAPLLNPDRLAELPVESVGSSPYRAPIDPTQPQLPSGPDAGRSSGGAVIARQDTQGLKVGPDGQVYGPPRDANSPLLTREEGISFDGQPVRSYEVQKYPEPMLFKTIASTQVLSAPSFLATSIARLEPETSIQVVSRMGQWLELRSIGGRRGFILAQDAQESR